ncbi:MAG: TetR family transcriptional regulator [Micromonosporaceae bacterium]
MTQDAATAAPQSTGLRTVILAAATEEFAERGYDQVTIRDIAARAGCSPAMVMKCGGSKRDLFYAAATINPPPLPDAPTSRLGAALVGDLIARFTDHSLEPLNRALVLRLTAPDPASVRERFITGYLDPLAERLGGGVDARLRAELVVAALLGLAATLRILEAPTARAATADVHRRYADVVQRLLTDQG